MATEEIRNAVISGVRLGYDRGALVAGLTLSWESASQGFGDYQLDEWRPRTSRREGTVFGTEFIMSLLTTVGVESWHHLINQPVRIKRVNNMIVAIGHYTRDIWFSPMELYDSIKRRPA